MISNFKKFLRSFLKSLKSFLVYKVYTIGSKILNDLRNSDQRCSIKNVFIKVSQNSLENNCVGVSFFLSWRLKHLQVTVSGI